MRIDEYGLAVMEHVEWPGSIGDAAAETSRLMILGHDFQDEMSGWIRLQSLITATGYLRHPTAPEGWRQSDFSNDQFLPLMMAWDLCDAPVARPRDKGFKIFGTKTLLSPLNFCLVRKWFTAINILNMIQGWIFLIPYRWSDDDRLKGKLWKFERSEGSSADYLNFVISYIYLKKCNKWARLNADPKKCLEKIESYYRNEPNSEFVVSLYRKHLGLEKVTP